MQEASRAKVLQFVQNSLLFGDSTVLPRHIDKYLMGFADEEFGQNWVESPDVGMILAGGLQAIKKSLVTLEPPEWDLASLMAQLFGYGPLHFHKVPFLLRNLLRKAPFKSELKLLDLGCGAGVASLSAIFFFELVANAVRIVSGGPEDVHLRLTPLDSRDEALRLYQKLLQNYRPALSEIRVDIGDAILATITPEPEALANTFGNEKFDLILASHFFCELRKPSLTARAKLLAEFGKYLEPGGTILFVESAAGAIPSEMNQLKSRAVGEGLTLFNPCSSAWDKPTGRQCYSCGNVSFERVRKPMIAEILSTLCEQYSFDDVAAKISWAFGILRPDEVVHHPMLEGIGSGEFTKISDLAAIGEGRANIYGSVAKLEIARVDGETMFKICDQTCGSDVAWLKYSADAGVQPLENGDVLEIENASIVPAKGGKNKVFVVVDSDSRVRNLSRDFHYLPSKHVLTAEVLK